MKRLLADAVTSYRMQICTMALSKDKATHKHEARQKGEYQQQAAQPILGRPRGVLVGRGINAWVYAAQRPQVEGSISN
jgi:hypothetical protein